MCVVYIKFAYSIVTFKRASVKYIVRTHQQTAKEISLHQTLCFCLQYSVCQIHQLNKTCFLAFSLDVSAPNFY